MEITDDATSAIGQISQCIERDPGLSAKVLKVSNSPYYGMKQYVSSLKLALVILGVRELRNILIGVTVFDTLRANSCGSPVLKDFWPHSFWVGAMCKKLGAALTLGLQGEDFIAGLLHDIGKLVLLRGMGSTYETVLKPVVDCTSDERCRAEAGALGFDHADAGGALAVEWNLPTNLVDAIWCHHPRQDSPLDAAKDPRLAALVRIANRACHEDLTLLKEPQSCVDEEAWGILAPRKGPLDVSSRKEMLIEFMKEIREMPAFSF
jgi:HD-like signal output (HDOD) protein